MDPTCNAVLELPPEARVAHASFEPWSSVFEYFGATDTSELSEDDLAMIDRVIAA